MTIIILVGLILLGLCLGSFAGAQVWRLRARQLREDKAAGEEYSKAEYKRLAGLSSKKQSADRSVCLSCHHQLAWYDLLPLVSWLSTAGKCRYCRKSIGWFEPLMELGVAAFFATSFVFWPESLTTPLEIFQFILWLVGGVMLAILFAYDSKWFLLPDVIIFPLIAVSAVFAATGLLQTDSIATYVISVVAAVGILSGIYLILWLLSKGAWIGFGDIKLGLALALLLSSWQLAFLTLFLANLIGCLIVIPGLLTKKISRTTAVPFGPMLIVGFLISGLAGDRMIDWYIALTTNLLV